MPLLVKDYCGGSELYLTVEVGLVTTGVTYGIWNTAIWDTTLWGFSETWTDISNYVEKVTTSRAFSRPVRVWSAASISIDLNDQDGRFSPDNLTGPYVVAGLSSIRPGCGVRAKLTFGGVDYPLAKGYVDEWAEGWDGVGGPRTGVATTSITAADEWARISAAPGVTVAPVGAGEYFGPRINRLLDAAGSVSPRMIDTGTATMQATDLSSDPVQDLELTCDSEGGSIMIDGSGMIVAKRKYALVEETRSTTVQATFGDGVGEIPWSEIETAPLNLSGLINRAAYTRVGGTQQVYSDPNSVALYGPAGDKSPNVDQLICDSDAQALSLATWSVLSHKDPQTLVTGLTVPASGLTAWLPTLLGLQHMDLVKVVRRPPSATSHTVTRYCFIDGIEYTIESGKVDIKFTFTPATKYLEFSTSKWDLGLWDTALWFT
jgi:hypothetical protein